MRLVLLLAALALSACSVSPIPPQPTQTSQPQALNTAIASSIPPTLPATVTASPTPPFTPAPLSPTPLPPAPAEPLSPENISSLAQVEEILLSPWELVLRLAWSPDGKILAVSAGEHIYLYPTGSFEGRKDITAKGSCPGMAFSPGGELLACGGRDGVVHVWETATGAERFAIAAHKKAINAVAFSPEGNLLASAGNDGMARLWEVSSSAKNGEMIGGSFAIPALAFSLDGASLAIANAKVVRWRDIETGRFVQTLRSEEAIFSLALSPDGSTLAAGSSTGNVLRWDLASGEAMPPLDGKAVGLVWQVTYSSDGKLLASASADGVIRVWEVGTGSLLLNLTAHQKAATSLAFSPDGLWLASGGLDGRVILWTVDLK